jgi:hypothetical protein
VVRARHCGVCIGIMRHTASHTHPAHAALLWLMALSGAAGIKLGPSELHTAQGTKAFAREGLVHKPVEVSSAEALIDERQGVITVRPNPKRGKNPSTGPPRVRAGGWVVVTCPLGRWIHGGCGSHGWGFTHRWSSGTRRRARPWTG